MASAKSYAEGDRPQMVGEAPDEAHEGARERRDRLVMTCYWLAYKISGEFQPPPYYGVTREDLFQEALVGLMRAAVRYEEGRGEWPVFAAYWMRLWVRQRLSELAGGMIRLPRYLYGTAKGEQARERVCCYSTEALQTKVRSEALASSTGERDFISDPMRVMVSREEGPYTALERTEAEVREEEVKKIMERLLDREEPLRRYVLCCVLDREEVKGLAKEVGVSRQRIYRIWNEFVERVREEVKNREREDAGAYRPHGAGAP